MFSHLANGKTKWLVTGSQPGSNVTFHASLPFIKRVDIPFDTYDLLAVAYEALPDLVSMPTF